METQVLLSGTSPTITFHSNKQATTTWSTMFQQAFFWLVVPNKLQQDILIFISTKSNTQSSLPPAALFHVCLFGVASLGMWQHGPRPSLPAEQDPASRQDEATLHPHPPAPLHPHPH
jgi:hypothetical protein